MNLLDKAINYVNPKAGAKRIAARKMVEVLASGYGNGGASHSKKSLLGWRWGGGSPDGDITEHQKTLRERNRDLVMNAPFASGAVKTYRANVVGPGLRLKSQIDAEFLGLGVEEAQKWEKNVEREFQLWAKNCSMTKTMDFEELQALAFYSQLMSGDVFATLPLVKDIKSPYMLKINLIEADRVCNPNGIYDPKIIEGIELDEYGCPIAYHICDKHPLETRVVTPFKWIRVPAFGTRTGRRNILHLMEYERPGQRRGVPLFAPVVETLKNLTRFTEAELNAAVIRSYLTVFITSQTPDNPLGMLTEDTDIPTNDNEIQLASGNIIALNPGEDVKEMSSKSAPNTAFDSFVISMCRQIGAAIELPHEVLTKHFTASYSASRAALLEAWKSFKMRRVWLSKKFCQPIYEEFLYEAIATGRIQAPGFFEDLAIRNAYCGATWHGPSQGQIDPLKEANAAVVRINNCLSTSARETAELTGEDFETVVKQRSYEMQAMKEGGLIVEQQVLENPQPNDGQQE